MNSIQSRFVSWSGEDRKIGELVEKRLEGKLSDIISDTYNVVYKKAKAEKSSEERERRKFSYISKGDSQSDYFKTIELVIKYISSHLDLTDYLVGAYATYTTGLVTALLKSGRLFDGQRDLLLASLIRSVFSDVAVVVHYFVEAVNQKAEAEKRQAMERRER
ncbi:hypothetical protein [Azospirillum sp. B510]|uniref:hypothetical protein n=1 Tax=Azospirillum sp. (strain B510) TaxID=137722 RepID=UPI0011D08642|nr:hypothetical protein [Azospirillum sp. B510]